MNFAVTGFSIIDFSSTFMELAKKDSNSKIEHKIETFNENLNIRNVMICISMTQ